MQYTDYYAALGIKRDADQEEIKRAYRKLARKYHPDVSTTTDNAARFNQIGEAWEVLQDPEKRAAYDELGANWQAGQDFRPPPDWNRGWEFRGDGGSEGFGASEFSDFFETLFGRTGGTDFSRAPKRSRGTGEDHHAKIIISLEDSYSGATRGITLRAAEYSRNGKIETKERTLNVKIPKGVRQGQTIRLAGQGGPGLGGASPGDLYLEIGINPHRYYRVEGSDVYLDLPIAPWEAALGDTVKVPIPSGVIDLKIPKGSEQGRVLRLKGRGLPAKKAGDFFVVIQISLPPADSKKAEAAYETLKNNFDFNPRAGLGV
jgi:curved DNA-binding protein